MIELTARTIPDATIRVLLEAAQLADAVQRFVARAWCADEVNRRARLATEYPRRPLTDTAPSSERR